MCKLLSGTGPASRAYWACTSWTSCSTMKFSVGPSTSLHRQALLSSFLSGADSGSPEVAKVELCAAVRQMGLVHFVRVAQCCDAETLNPLKLRGRCGNSQCA